MRILITGASGLIGTHLLATAKDLEVISVVNHNPVQVEGSTVLQGDLTDSAFLDSLPKVDYIIHGAGYGQPRKFTLDPIKTIKLNTTVLLKLFDKLNNDGKLLYLSTSEVYSGAKPPYKETDIGTTSPNHPRACYIESKRCGEAICNAYGAKIARLSLVYGPGARGDDERVMSDFIRQGLKGEIHLLDAGQALRTYCYVTDAAELLWKILLHGQGTYNVGGHSQVSIKELAMKIGTVLNAKVFLGTKKLDGAPEDVSLDMSATEKEFNKSIYVDLDEGLRQTIEWHKQIGG